MHKAALPLNKQVSIENFWYLQNSEKTRLEFIALLTLSHKLKFIFGHKFNSNVRLLFLVFWTLSSLLLMRKFEIEKSWLLLILEKQLQFVWCCMCKDWEYGACSEDASLFVQKNWQKVMQCGNNEAISRSVFSGTPISLAKNVAKNVTQFLPSGIPLIKDSVFFTEHGANWKTQSLQYRGESLSVYKPIKDPPSAIFLENEGGFL